MTFRWMSEEYLVKYLVFKYHLCLNSHLLKSSSKDVINAYDQWIVVLNELICLFAIIIWNLKFTIQRSIFYHCLDYLTFLQRNLTQT